MGAAEGAKGGRGQSTCSETSCERVRVKVRFKEQGAEVYAFVQQFYGDREGTGQTGTLEDAWPSVWGATVQFRG